MRGVELYQQSNYANAWLEFTSAYQLVPLTALLNNMARCEVKIGRPAEALVHFKNYIAATPTDPDAEYIRQEIARLDAELGRRAAPSRQAAGDSDAAVSTAASPTAIHGPRRTELLIKDFTAMPHVLRTGRASGRSAIKHPLRQQVWRGNPSP